MIKRPALAVGQSLCVALLACEHPEVVPFVEADASGRFADAANETNEDSGSDSGTDSGADASTDGGAHSSDASGEAASDSGANGASSKDSGATSIGLDGAMASLDAGLARAREICRAACETVEHLPCYSQSCVADCLLFRESVPACADFADAFQRCKATLGEQDSACDAQGAIVRTTEECQSELDEWLLCTISQG